MNTSSVSLMAAFMWSSLLQALSDNDLIRLVAQLLGVATLGVLPNQIQPIGIYRVEIAELAHSFLQDSFRKDFLDACNMSKFINGTPGTVDLESLSVSNSSMFWSKTAKLAANQEGLVRCKLGGALQLLMII